MILDAVPIISLFYCYAHEDALLRDELDKHLAMLRQLGWIQSWSDRDVSAGTDLQQAMDHHLDTANLLLVLVSADFINSDYCYGVELHRALERHQAGEAIVIPILLRPVEWEKTPLGMLQALPKGGRPVVQWDQPDEAFQQIATEIRMVVEALRQDVPFPHIVSSSGALISLGEPRNPYKGLRAFTANDTNDFFGRTSLIDELVRSIETMLSFEKKARQSARLLAVVGPSGSGKSSVVMAGLVPCLRTGEIFEGETWIYLDPFVPGEHPLEALALALFDHLPEKSLQMLSDDLYDDAARGLHLYATSLARRTTSINPHIVLVVDQFEELFTLTIDEQERQQFINLLVTACTQRDGPLIVILTLRADFYDRPMRYPTLYALIEKYQVATLPMPLENLRTVITRPAMLPNVQITFEENLIDDLLFDVQGQPGALPLLQFTLDQLFQQRDGRLLTLSAYHKMGKVKGALSRHAEQAYQDLPSLEHRTNARTLFLRLIDPGFTEQDTARRRADLSEFTFADTTLTQSMQETIEMFVQARLLITSRHADRITVEVSHEAVIREWKRLSGWLYEARDDIHLQQKISLDATEWKQYNKLEDRLYRGSQLKEARAWTRRDTLSENETAFLHASIRADIVRHLRYAASVTIIVLLLLSTTGLLGWLFTRPIPTLVSNLQDNDNPGSLRYAINEAPVNSTITFAPGLHGHILLLSNLNIAKNLEIKGPGRNVIWISAGKSNNVIHVVQNTTITVSDLTFKDSITTNSRIINNDGKLSLVRCVISNNTFTNNAFVNYSSIDGGGILNNGILNLINSSILHNTVTAGVGGGISNKGTLSVINSVISNNTATGGGGIDNNDGKLSVINSVISNNTATGVSGGVHGEGGGGISSNGTLNITNSAILNNTAIGTGGGIFSNSSFSLINSSISNNSAKTGGDGGGIATDSPGHFVITNSSISNNSATGNGGGISNYGSFSLINSSISNNSATGNGGGISSYGGNSTDYNRFIITNSSVSNNTATGNGGGVSNGYNDGSFNNFSLLTSLNSSIVDNKAVRKGGGLFVQSRIDGISIFKAKIDITFNTIYGNTAKDNSDITIEDIAISYGGNLGDLPSSKVIKQSSQVKVKNSIIASNSTSSSNIGGKLTSYGYNLFRYNSGAIFDSNTEIQHATDKYMLDEDLHKLFTSPVNLKNNGGPTETLALAADSPAVDQIPQLACHINVPSIKNPIDTPTAQHYTITTDQRGVKRSDNGENMCDIGAYEYVDAHA